MSPRPYKPRTPEVDGILALAETTRKEVYATERIRRKFRELLTENEDAGDENDI